MRPGIPMLQRGVAIGTALALVAFGVGVVSLVSCSGGGTGSTGTPNPGGAGTTGSAGGAGSPTSGHAGGSGSIAIQDLGSRDVDAECSRGVRCGFYPDQPTCVAANPSILGQLMADVQAGKVKYDGAAASDCLNALAAQGCALSATHFFKEPQSCNQAFQGTAAAGAPCFINQECVSGSCTLPPSATGLTCIAGTCDAVFVPIAQGENCTIDGPEFQCVDGAYCQVTAGGTNRTCQPLLAVGEACSAPDACADGAECVGTCQAFPSEGQPCGPNGECDAFADFCDITSHTCVRRRGVGGSCATGDECVQYAGCDPATMKCGARSNLGTPVPVPPVCP